MRLSDLCSGKDNNLNLLRFAAAMAVLFSHSFPLSTGDTAGEPMRAQLGMTLGSIAVDVFFVISGFLVTASILRSRSLVDFVVSRCLRIYPALLVMLVITVLGMGLALTTLPARAYLSAAQTHEYLLWCATLVRDVKFELPGLFEANPYKKVVNGSLWTLPYELRMYGLLAGGWLLCRLLGAIHTRLFAAACVLTALSAGTYLFATHTRTSYGTYYPWLIFMFFTGASLFVLRRWVWLSATACLAACAILVAVAVWATPYFGAVYLLCVAYITLCMAYLPKGRIRQYNRLGDFSYGIYIYAFPIQQATAALIPGIAPLALFAIAGPVTLALAVASWYGVERRALRRKNATVNRLMGLAGYTATPCGWQRGKRA